MRFLTDMFPNTPAMRGAPVVDSISPIWVDGPEPLAIESWVFSDAESLEGLYGRSVLFPAGETPIFGKSSLTIPAGVNGLVSEVKDSGSYAIGLAVRLTASGGRGRVLAGTFNGSAGDGAMIYMSTGDNISAWYRPAASTPQYSGAQVAAVLDQWVYLGIAFDAAQRRCQSYLHGVGLSALSAAADTWTPGDRGIALGNAHYGSSGNNYKEGFEVAGMDLFNGVPTATEWAQIGARAALKHSARGLNLLRPA